MSKLNLFFSKALLFVAKIIQNTSYKNLNLAGNFLGRAIYYLVPKYRKRILSNLSLASSFQFTEKMLKETAIKSLQSLATALLEFPKFYTENDLSQIVCCTNPEIADQFIKKGQGVIFFCAHQANWELFFLEGNSRMKGVAIGRPIKNSFIYDWILKVRTRFGGEIIEPKKAMKEGLKALKEGKFLGIVGDQGMPESSFHSSFLGMNAYSTTAPALLSYKTSCPLIVATMIKKDEKYFITYADPIIPNLLKPIREEVERMTHESLTLLEHSILQNPSQWLWIHNRFKQETPKNVFYRFRHDTILWIVYSMNQIDTTVIRKIYPKAILSFYSLDQADQGKENVTCIDIKKPLPKDYRFKMVVNLTRYKNISTHFKKLSALEVIEEKTLDKILKKRGFLQSNTLNEKIIYSFSRNPQEFIGEPYAT